MNKWMLIANPGAASSQAGDNWKQSLQLLEEAGFTVETAISQSPGHAIELAMEAAEDGNRQFIA